MPRTGAAVRAARIFLPRPPTLLPHQNPLGFVGRGGGTRKAVHSGGGGGGPGGSPTSQRRMSNPGSALQGRSAHYPRISGPQDPDKCFNLALALSPSQSLITPLTSLSPFPRPCLRRLLSPIGFANEFRWRCAPGQVRTRIPSWQMRNPCGSGKQQSSRCSSRSSGPRRWRKPAGRKQLS